MPSNFSPPLGLSYFSLKTNDPHNSKKLTRKILPEGWRNKAVTGRFCRGHDSGRKESVPCNFSPPLLVGTSHFSLTTGEPHNNKKLTRKTFQIHKFWRNKTRQSCHAIHKPYSIHHAPPSQI